MIFFKKIRWKNFLSTGNTFTEVDFTKSNLTLIVGDNGAGKSTILDALCFSLFNKPFRKINKPQLINTINGKDAVVEIEFSIGKKNYKIIRGLKPNTFEMYLGDILINQDADKRDYQEVLEKQILKLNYKSFCQVVILGSASFVPFMQLPTGSRREIIEDLLDLQIFSQMNSVLKKKITENNEKTIRFDASRDTIERTIEVVKGHIKTVQDSNEKLAQEKLDRIEQTDREIQRHSSIYHDIEEEIKQFEVGCNDEFIVSKKASKLETLKHQIEARVKIISGDLEFFTNNDECPTCKQLIHETHKATMVGAKNEKLQELNEGISKLALEYDETRKRLDEVLKIKTEVNSKKMELHKHSTQINSLLSYKDMLEKELKQTKSDENVEEQIIKLSQLQTDLSKAIDDYNESVEDGKIFNMAATLMRDDGIKSRIIRQYVPIINKFINKYLAAMDFFVNFELDENFNETIKSRFRDEFSYASFSEGEKMRINLAILFTWRAISKLRNSASTNLLIMDEVLDGSLDSNGTDEFLKILAGLVTDTNTYVISHKTDQLYDKFANVLKFEKHKNFSRIVS